jgi:hypothetical protein
MQNVQGYIRSQWLPSLGDYSLYIALEAARVAGKPTTMKNTPSLLAILMAVAVRRYNTACTAQ